MKKLYLLLYSLGICFLFSNCSKKTNPSQNSSRSVYGSEKNVSGNTVKPVSTKRIKTPTPKVIAVNDSIAHKTFDGRLYYDLEGHRYWRNYKDGKYYLYNKSMSTDPAFKKP